MRRGEGCFVRGLAGTSRHESRDSATHVAVLALRHLGEADAFFSQQGMDPWTIYSLIQQAKALADLRRVDDAQSKIDIAARGIERFPIWKSHALEAVGQVLAMHGSAEQARTSFQRALDAAAASGLLARVAHLEQYL